MCFSATASFATAAVTAAIGAVALGRVRDRHDIPLVVVPFGFAAQQAVEGTLWLLLDRGIGDGPAVAALSLAFLLFAEVLWPAFIPLAVLLDEPDPRRRLSLRALAASGAALALYLLAALLQTTTGVAVHGANLRYDFTGGGAPWVYLPYVVVTCGPLLLSSHRIVRLAGGVTLLAFAVSFYAYYQALVSVWCFFAAVISTLVYAHIRVRAADAEGPIDPIRHGRA